MQAKVFEAFEQADNTTTRRYGGTGLGLAISRKLAQLLGGSLSILSSSSAGTSFLFSLPLKKITAPKPTRQKNNLQDSLSIKFDPRQLVLVAEDNAINLKVIGALLKRVGLPFRHAHNGLEAVKLCRELKPQLVFMDLHMPEMDGLVATRHIRQQPWGVDIPIVAVSADAFEEPRNLIIEAGADDYITKPIHFDTFLATLKRYLVMKNISGLEKS